jgi:putative tricarboxylic transport membrane protein
MADRVIFLCILVLAGIYFYATEKLPSLEIGDPLGPKAFPRLLGVILLVTAAVMFFEMLRARKLKRPPAKKAEAGDRGAYLIIAGVVVWTFLFFLVFERLGFVIATTIYLFGLTSYFHRGKVITNAVVSVLFCVGSYYMFKVLGVNLAPGIFPFS